MLSFNFADFLLQNGIRKDAATVGRLELRQRWSMGTQTAAVTRRQTMFAHALFYLNTNLPTVTASFLMAFCWLFLFQ